MILAALLAFVLAIAAPTTALAQDPDIIRGTVVGPGGQPIAEAQVSVISLAAQTTRTGRTDSGGRFTILFANGGGDYFVRVLALGMAPYETRVQRIEDDPVLLVNIEMVGVAAMLEEVRIQAERERVRREALGLPDVGGSETRITNEQALLTPGELGDLAAIAATVAGVTLVPGEDGSTGFSVLGLGTDQNSVTMNGMEFDGSNVPRDAAVTTTFSTTTFDVSRGGFSGGQLSLRASPATNFVRRSFSFSLDHPTMQWTDPSAARGGQEFSNYQLGGGFSGPLVRDKAFYNVSAQIGRRANDIQSLLNSDDTALLRMGLARDSLNRFLSLLDPLGVPASAGGVPGSQHTDRGTLMARVDLAPSGQRTLGFTANADWSRTGGGGIGSFSLPARGTRSNRIGGSLQADMSTYFKSFLNETNLSVSTRMEESEPYATLPSGSVRITSDLPDGTTGISTIGFGGNGSLPRESSSKGVQLANTTSWFSMDSRHRLKLSAELRFDSYTRDESSGQLGSFTYNSLNDLEAGLPASYSRSLTPRVRDGDALNLAVSLGDEWRPSRTNRNLRVQYGVRVEAARFGTTPRFNPEVEQLFGLRTDRVPASLAVSPRVGFNWSYGSGNRLSGPFNEGTRGTISGGIGQFRNSYSSSLLSQAVENTGLPDASQFLNCLGPAAPSPEWDQYAADLGNLPASCADGSGAEFREQQPRVFVFDPAYQSQLSWRANIAWSGRMTQRFRARVELLHSLNLNQPGTFDVNFAGAEQFRLEGEGGRPVYVSPSGIVPATGGVSLLESRLHEDYTQVNAQRSDLKSRTTRLSFNLSPQGSLQSDFNWSAGYSLSWSEDFQRGFGGSTAGDPRLREWGTSGQSRHQFNLNGSYNIRGKVNLSINSRVSSGRRYTPRVAGDVNGDGMANDRAFIPNPGDPQLQVVDMSLANAMQTLIDNSTGRVSSCLTSQLGTLAGRNSCSGPWTVTMGMGVAIVPGSFGLPARTSVSLSLANPLPVLDELLHGRNGLRGWGQNNVGDQTLLYVRGFDPVNQRFIYDVNQRFGDTRPSRTVGRAPFQVSLMVRSSFGPTPEQQTLDRQLSIGRTREGSKLTAAQWKQQFTRSMSGPVQMLLRRGLVDSLRLTDEQLDSLTVMQANHLATLDAIFNPLSEHLASLGDKYDSREVSRGVKAAQEQATASLLSVTRRARAVLTPEQLRQLPSFLQSAFDERLMQRTRRAGGDVRGVRVRF